MNIGHGKLLFVIVVISVCYLAASSVAWTDEESPFVFQPIDVSGINPMVLPKDSLQPGLSVVYYLKFFPRHLQELPKTEKSEYRSFRGEPILWLNHQFGKGKVFDSGSNRGVGMRMKGYIHFKEKGFYHMQALSNDGIILYLSSKLTINDPEQHSDRLSNVAYITIDKAGWYPVVIEYFQRKGTSALKLLWKEPGSDSFVPVPRDAYGHQL